MPARNITVTFAALSFPGKVAKATDEDQSLSNFCTGQGDVTHDPSPVKSPSTCVHCGVLPSYEGAQGIVKGIKEGEHTFRILDAEELADIQGKYAGQYKAVIELIPHPAADIMENTAPGKSVNFLTPNGQHGANQYRALVNVIEEHPELAFVGLHTPVSRTHLWHVRVHKGVLLMEERVREDMMRQVPEVSGEVNDKVESMVGWLELLLPELVTPYSKDDYEDTYAAALLAVRGNSTVVAMGDTAEKVAATGSDSQVIELLQARMDRIKAAAKKAPAKKTAAARKTAAKKTTRKRVSA